jgi:hypothetical protein
VALVTGKDGYDFQALGGKLEALFPENLDYRVFDLFRCNRTTPYLFGFLFTRID